MNELRLVGSCTALWRGYVAIWKIENDSLFLVRIQTDYCGDPVEIDLIEEFNLSCVFFDWASFTIASPQGELLDYVHQGYLSIYEKEVFYTLQKASLPKRNKKNM